MIERAQADGAKLLAGGRAPSHLPNGFFVEPTVLGDVDPASELGQIEVFGPVLSLMRFETEEQAIDIANSTEYGLASYVYTKDIGRIQRMVTALQAGGVYIMARALWSGVSSPSEASASRVTAARGERKGCSSSCARKRLVSHGRAAQPQRRSRCAHRRGQRYRPRDRARFRTAWGVCRRERPV